MDNLWRFSPKKMWRHSRRISQPTMQLTSCRLYLAIWADLQPIGIRVENVNGLHRGKPSQQVYSAIIIASGSANPLRKKEGLRVKALCGLPSAQSGDGQESVSPPSNLRDAGPCI